MEAVEKPIYNVTVRRNSKATEYINGVVSTEVDRGTLLVVEKDEDRFHFFAPGEWSSVSGLKVSK